MFWYLIEPPSEWMSDLFVDVVAVVTINILMKHTVIYFMTTTANNKTKMSTYLIKAARVGSGDGNGNGNSILTKYSILISSWRSSQPTATMIKKQKKTCKKETSRKPNASTDNNSREQQHQHHHQSYQKTMMTTKRMERKKNRKKHNTHTHIQAKEVTLMITKTICVCLMFIWLCVLWLELFGFYVSFAPHHFLCLFSLQFNFFRSFCLFCLWLLLLSLSLFSCFFSLLSVFVWIAFEANGQSNAKNPFFFQHQSANDINLNIL